MSNINIVKPAVKSSIAREKLGENNYSTWRQETIAAAIKHDNVKHILGLVPKPEALVPIGASQKVVNEKLREIQNWEVKDLKARLDLVTFIEPSQYCHIQNCTSAHEVWRKLEELYDTSDTAKKAALLKNILLNKRLSKDCDIFEEIENFFLRVEELRGIGVTIPEEVQSMLLLNKVPRTCDSFLNLSFDPKDDELRIANRLKSKLIGEYNSNGQLFSIHESPDNGFRMSLTDANFTFCACGFINHTSGFCPLDNSFRTFANSTGISKSKDSLN